MPRPHCRHSIASEGIHFLFFSYFWLLHAARQSLDGVRGAVVGEGRWRKRNVPQDSIYRRIYEKYGIWAAGTRPPRPDDGLPTIRLHLVPLLPLFFVSEGWRWGIGTGWGGAGGAPCAEDEDVGAFQGCASGAAFGSGVPEFWGCQLTARAAA